MKQYYCMVVFQEKDHYLTWLEGKIQDSGGCTISGTYPFQELKLRYENHLELWQCNKYNTYRPFQEYLCGIELYYFEFLDGLYKGEDITYLMSRVRNGVDEVDDE